MRSAYYTIFRTVFLESLMWKCWGPFRFDTISILFDEQMPIRFIEHSIGKLFWMQLLFDSKTITKLYLIFFWILIESNFVANNVKNVNDCRNSYWITDLASIMSDVRVRMLVCMYVCVFVRGDLSKPGDSTTIQLCVVVSACANDAPCDR